MADITGYIADFFAGVGEGLEKIEKTLERNVIKYSLAPAKKSKRTCKKRFARFSFRYSK